MKKNRPIGVRSLTLDDSPPASRRPAPYPHGAGNGTAPPAPPAAAPVGPETTRKPPPGAHGAAAIECPFCHKFGCSAWGGSKQRGTRRVRYRRCNHCRNVFRTDEVRGGGEVWEGMKHPDRRQ